MTLNERAIFEVGNIIHVRRNWNFIKLSAQEILDSVEYQKEFKTRYPELSKMIEEGMVTKPRGWANLQQQLKEVREESFKQGRWQGIEEGKAQAKKEELEWLKSFQEHALKYYKFQNLEYNTKIEERIKELEDRL